MRVSIVKSIKSSFKDGLKRLLVEVLKDDSQEHVAYTVPGVLSVPLKNEKCLLIPTDKTGKAVAMGVPVTADIPEGEIKVYGRDSNGQIKGSLYIDGEGNVTIGLSNFQGVITELFKPFFDAHTHDVVIQTAKTLPPSVAMPDSVISQTVKVQL